MQIRIATPDDVVPLAEMFANSVRPAGPAAYSPAQVGRWAAAADDLVRFRDFILHPTTYLAIDETGLIGFGGIEEHGHVASLDVRGNRQRSGIGTRLMEEILDHAVRTNTARLYVEASEFRLPLFLKMGFQMIGTETVDRDGSTFVRHLVESMT